jgi:hypothetical protein
MIKNIIRLFIILLLPLTLHAQDTALVKRQANVLAQAMIAGDYKTIINHTYPKAIQMSGGKENMINVVSKGMDQMKAQGMIFESATVGTPGKFYKAGKEIHCLIPETLVIKLPSARVATHSHILAISADGGKNWSFLDVNSANHDKLKMLLPNLNPAMVIPKSTTEKLN